MKPHFLVEMGIFLEGDEFDLCRNEDRFKSLKKHLELKSLNYYGIIMA